MKNSDSERSNLLTDKELMQRFNKQALIVARDLRKKYYSVFYYITEEDLVSECWDKIARQNIGFNSERGCKFETFVRMLVSNRCKDMCRRFEKLENITSLDKDISKDSEGTTLMEFVEDKRCYGEGFLEIESVIDSCNSDFRKSKLKLIYDRKKSGYTDAEIACELGVKVSVVKNILKDMKPVFMSRLYGNYRTLEDVLYGDEDYLCKNKEVLVNTLSYVSDDSGVSLSDIVKMVIDGATYRQIQNSLGVSEENVKNLLDKYMKLKVAL